MVTRVFSPRQASEVDPSDADLDRPGGRGREAAALLLMALALALCLALASLRADPNNPNLTGDDWVGPVGATLAGLLARGFGFVAWLVPIQLVVFAVPLLRGSSPRHSGFRVAGDLVVAIIAAALTHVALPSATCFGHLPAGGNVGLLFGELIQALFSTAGSFLLGVTAIALILIGRASFSFIAFCRGTAHHATRFALWLRQSWARVLEAWREARQLRRERRRAEREARAPVIDEKPSDEAIIAQLEEDGDWVPLERTGEPPLAVSEALKEGLLDVDDSPWPGEHADDRIARDESSSPADPESTRTMPPKVEHRQPVGVAAPGEPLPDKRRGPRRESAAAPTIVDTTHNSQIRRDSAQLKLDRPAKGYELPKPELLKRSGPSISKMDRERILEHAGRLEKTLADYGVVGKVEEIHPGPTVTTYEVAPQAGTKVGKVAGLSDDLALGLSRKVRIIAPIPGKGRIGFELPNDERAEVNLRELIEDERFGKLAAKAPLPVVLGRDIVGAPFYADLASMPHVIVAGATGAGKSVGLNVMLSSMLFRRTPDELRLLMIDPKVVELAPFDGIPHMLLPVVTDMKQASTALKWAVDEMERRYQAFATAGTKNITTYNQWVARLKAGKVKTPTDAELESLTGEGGPVSVKAPQQVEPGVALLPGRLPHIVVVVDEFADLMMQQGKEVETCVARLAQKARAAGMHVVLATQRPSVDVITGMIKANFPTRVAYRVAQKVDSRTILDEQGAELLLGKGDMLVKMNGSNETRRVQCPFVSEEEVAALTDFLRTQGEPEYHDDILKAGEDDEHKADEDEPVDPRFDEAVRIVADTQRCSTSWLQRKLTIGYNRAAKIVEMMEQKGMVGPPNGAREREIFLNSQ